MRARQSWQFNNLSYIHLGSSVCHPVCHPVILSSCHSCGTLSYSLCLSNQTYQETKGRVSRGRDTDGKIGEGQIVEGGCEETFNCLIQTKEKSWFTVPPAVALLNYTSSGLLWRIFCQTEIFAGFSLHIINLAVYKDQRSYDGRGHYIF